MSIDQEIARLEERKKKLERLIELRMQVSLLETNYLHHYRAADHVKAVLRGVGEKFGVSVPDMLSAGRGEAVVIPRQLVFFLLREMFGLSYPTLGKTFAKDHGTIIHGCRATRNRMDTDGRFAALVEEIRREVESSVAGGGQKRAELPICAAFSGGKGKG